MSQKEIVRKKSMINSSTIQKLAIFASLLLLVIFFSFASPYFLKYDNIITVIKQTAVTGIVAIGITIVIITAGIDLSVGSIVAVSGVIVALLLRSGMAIAPALVIGVIAGILCGAFSGVVVAHLELPPFIATLGVMISARGFALVLSGGRPIYFNQQQNFKLLYNYDMYGILPMPVIYLAVFAVIAHLLLSKTVVGRYIFALGSNEEAARLSGISVKLVKFFVYTFSGAMCGFAGIIMAARLNSGQPSIATGLELDAIAAAVIGGASLSGGVGTILGTVIGALIMSVLRNGLNLMQVNQFWQQIIIGLVVILAVYLDNQRIKRGMNNK